MDLMSHVFFLCLVSESASKYVNKYIDDVSLSREKSPSDFIGFLDCFTLLPRL